MHAGLKFHILDAYLFRYKYTKVDLLRFVTCTLNIGSLITNKKGSFEGSCPLLTFLKLFCIDLITE